ncbi:MAG: hypothetical protein PHW74_01615 [Desulfobacca sp.]|nr:hypothetical protein [Desulfobacca sp.]
MMRKLCTRLMVSGFLAGLLVLLLAGALWAHDCSSPADCEQTAGYNAVLAIVGGFMGILAALLGPLLSGAASHQTALPPQPEIGPAPELPYPETWIGPAPPEKTPSQEEIFASQGEIGMPAKDQQVYDWLKGQGLTDREIRQYFKNAEAENANLKAGLWDVTDLGGRFDLFPRINEGIGWSLDYLEQFTGTPGKGIKIGFDFTKGAIDGYYQAQNSGQPYTQKDAIIAGIREIIWDQVTKPLISSGKTDFVEPESLKFYQDLIGQIEATKSDYYGATASWLIDQGYNYATNSMGKGEAISYRPNLDMRIGETQYFSLDQDYPILQQNL